MTDALDRPRRFSGSLRDQYSVLDVPGDPGGAQPWRHTADAPGAGTDRDDAPQGGGWQPTAWGTLEPIPALPGQLGGQVPTHDGTGSHRGADGRGRRVPLIASQDAPYRGGHAPATLATAGASGAAHGGLTATGVSAPWANPGGLDLGTDYVPTATRHRQGLHLNRPRLRLVAILRAMSSRDAPEADATARRVGPVVPRLRRSIRPYGQVETDTPEAAGAPAPVTNAGPITGGWVM